MQEQVKQISSMDEIPLKDEIESGRLADYWSQVGLTAGPRVAREQVEALFKQVLEYPVSCVIWAPDTITAGRVCRLVVGGVDLSHLDNKDADPDEINALVDKHNPPKIDSSYCHYGQHDAYWLGYHLAYEGVSSLDLTEDKFYEPIVKGSAWFFYHDGVVILSDRVTPQLNNDGELHCTDGPVMWGLIYALQGLCLPRDYNWIVTERDTLTREKIDSIDNAEIRSVTIASYPDKYVTWEPIQTDRYGALYEVEGQDYMLVRVEDSSTNHVYWLRTDTGHTTAHSAVASTFHLTADEYDPLVET